MKLVPAVLVLMFAGCAPLNFFTAHPSPDEVPAPAPEQATTNQDSTNTAAEKPKTNSVTPHPHTLPQAVCAYLRSFHEPLPEPTNGSQESSGEASGKKSSNGDEDRDKEKKPSAEGGENKEKKGDNGKREKKEDEAKSGNGKEEKKEDEDKGDEKKDDKDKEPEVAWFSGHAQATMITQEHPGFRSPYIGAHSLLPNESDATSLTATLFLDARLWESGGSYGELVFDPELAGGRGLSGVNGVAGFPNGDITRVGTVEPTPYFARLFYRQTCGLGGEQEKVEDGPNQVAGMRDVDRLTLTVGKFAFTDVVDDNRYSHDPRTQFLNWALMYNGAWDYPANVRGYSYGIALDFNQKFWALRYGIMSEPEVANGAPLDPHFLTANGQVIEWEGRYWIHDHPGHLRLLTYLNHAHMGDYRETLEEMPVNPNIMLTREYRFKYGCGASWDQELTRDLGIFARLGWNDGHTESWAFTEIDRTAALGLLLKGRWWRRPDDTVGLAGAINGLSQDHRDYLAAGGLGFILGDGRLNYGHEEILETFYDFRIVKGIFVTADFQAVENPAYNRDRGPVVIYSLRAHIEF